MQDPSPKPTGLMIAGAMLSHPGRVRELNEDVVVYRIPSPDHPSAPLGMLALVADGMGGHAAGEVASQIAAQTIQLLYYQQDQPVPKALAEGLAAANTVIHDHGKAYPDCAGLGTTCTALVVRDDHAWLGHIGDSRAYLVRDGDIHQLSEDHSLVAQLVRDGTLTPAEAHASPDRNILLRALGTQPSAEPLIWSEGLPLKPGDVLVLCSDGLCDLVENSAIADTVTRLAPFEACENLIDAALAAGGHDNISVGVFSLSVPTALKTSERPTRRTDLATLPEIGP